MISVTNKFAATLYVKDMLFANFWDITINIITDSATSASNNNVAMDRIQYYIENMLDNSLLLGPSGTKLFDKNPIGIEVACNLLPGEPLDHLFTVCLYTKFSSIVEKMLFIESVELESYQSNGLRYTYYSSDQEITPLHKIIDDEFLEYCEYWNDPEIGLFRLDADGLQLIKQTWSDVDLLFNETSDEPRGKTVDEADVGLLFDEIPDGPDTLPSGDRLPFNKTPDENIIKLDSFRPKNSDDDDDTTPTKA